MSSSIISSFKSLNVATAQDFSDHEAIFQASYQYLAKIKEFRDIKAVHNVIVSLINTDRYYKALDFLKQVPQDILQEFPLEKAYIYYKTGNVKSVEEIYESSVSSSEISEILRTALKHVMAQCYYQVGRMSEALNLYHELITLNSVDNKLDIACNERAIISQISFTGSDSKPSLIISEDQKSYDFIFNEALIELRNNNIDRSLSLLKHASSLCTEHNLDSDPEDLAAELAPIELALAYVYQISGHTSQAISTLESLDMEGVTDLLTKQIIKGNLVSLTSTPENVNYTARELNYKNVLHLHRNKMTRSQYRSLVKNHLLLSYQSNTLSKVSSFFKTSFGNEFVAEFEGDYTPLLIKLLVRLEIPVQDLKNESNWKAVSKKVYKFTLGELSKGEINDTVVAAALLLVFINAKSFRFDQAIDVLETITLKELQTLTSNLHASLFSCLINLYEVTKSHKKLATLYSQIVEEFEKLSVEDLKSTLLHNFVSSVVFKLISVDSSIEVASILKNLKAAQPDNVVISLITEAENVSLDNDLASQEDVETLLEANVDQLIAQVPQTRAPSRKAKSALSMVTKKARKPKFSKSKVLKTGADFNPEKDLDQERWLPMKLRTYYKPSKKDLKKKIGGHQGAIELSPAPSGNSLSNSKKQQKKKKKGKK